MQGGADTAVPAAVAAVVEQAAGAHLYLWVLEQNVAAQRFYRSRGGTHAGTVPVGGDPRRLNGSPNKHRIVWRDLNKAGTQAQMS